MIGLVAITLPEFFPAEAQCINSLFASGLPMLHLRKPEANLCDVERLLLSIDTRYYDRIAIHYHHELAMRYSLGGIHLSGIAPDVPAGWQGRVSRSCHSLAEVEQYSPHCSYVFLSPIFDSISKQGYNSKFTLSGLQSAAAQGIINSRVVALGGITTDNLTVVKSLGFGGAAVLGALWQSREPQKIIQRFEQLNAVWQ